MRSGEVAEAVGVHVETLRYYERRGLLATPPRRASGYRDYPTDSVHRIRMIKKAQSFGLTLQEISDLLALHPHAAVACGDVEARLRAKMVELDDTIAALTERRRSLEDLLCDCCDGRQTQQACPALSQHPRPA